MYIDENIPSNYNRIAEISDNYIILVRENVLNSNNTYNAYIQYFNPSTQVIFINDYRIKYGDTYSIDYSYTSNQWGNFLNTGDLVYSLHTNEINNIQSDFFSRPDCANFLFTATLIIIFLLFCMNAVTSLVEKGGVFKN